MFFYLGGDFMIPVSWDEILSRFAGIPVVLYTLHNLHPAITCKTFHPEKTGSLFCTAGIPLCRDEIFPCNRFSLPRRDKKVSGGIGIKILGVVNWSQLSNQPSQLESVAARVLKLLQASSRFFKLLKAAARA